MFTSKTFAAIMFTDIVGYTAMMGENEEKTLLLVQQNQSIQKKYIEKYNGKLVKEIGDGLLAHFPDAYEAVKCGLEIQQNTQLHPELKTRIGIHWAQIIIEHGDIFGDGVNIASRIENLADPGGVYVSSTVVDHVEANQLEFKLLGPAKLKNVKKPVPIFALQGHSLPEASITRFKDLTHPKRKIPVPAAVLAFLFLIIIGTLIVNHFEKKSEITKAEASIIQIQSVLGINWRDRSYAYFIAKEAEEVIPNNQKVKDLIEKTSVKVNVTSNIPGAKVYYKLYKEPETDWVYLGQTPIDSIEVPICVLRWKFEKEGYATVFAAGSSYTFTNLTRMQDGNMFIGINLHRELDLLESIPDDMVRVAPFALPYGEIPGFFIDKYEVRNERYQEFVSAGGYNNVTYWQELAEDLSDTISLEQALKNFTDQSGQPGPATWQNGEFPKGKNNYPVTGVNWYEAMAYARYVGKSLPSKDHWGLARGEGQLMIQVPQIGGNAIFTPFSNFHGASTIEVGKLPSLTSYGAYDMAGNAREWCSNKAEQGRWMRGGAYNDNPYMFAAPSQAHPLDRSDRNGFRCALYLPDTRIPEQAFETSVGEFLIPALEIPDLVDDTQYEFFTTFFNYDETDLEAKTVSSEVSSYGYTIEKIEYLTAYDDEKMAAYLFLPNNVSPPYQTVIYGPGSNVLWQESSDDIEDFFEFKAFCEFFVKNGRAVVFPIIDESFERKVKTPSIFEPGTHRYTTWVSNVVKDYRRTLDYLQTRDDIDMSKVAFYGMSLGPTLGTYLTAVDDRIKTAIFYAGGLRRKTRPESAEVHYLARINVPVLMLNGRYDSIFGIDGITGMYEHIGTPEPDKKIILYESDHLAPQEDLIKETLNWLDIYFGKVDIIPASS